MGAEVPSVAGLLELAGVCIDTLNDIGGVSGTATPSTASSTGISKPPLPLQPFDVATTRANAVHALETSLLLATCQCALVSRRSEGSGLREEVADEVGDALRKAAATIKDAGGKVDLVEYLVRLSSRHLVVMK